MLALWAQLPYNYNSHSAQSQTGRVSSLKTLIRQTSILYYFERVFQGNESLISNTQCHVFLGKVFPCFKY